jgi:hypothetical protein
MTGVLPMLRLIILVSFQETYLFTDTDQSITGPPKRIEWMARMLIFL